MSVLAPAFSNRSTHSEFPLEQAHLRAVLPSCINMFHRGSHIIMVLATIIHENLIAKKNFVLHKMTKNFLCEFFTSNITYGEYMAHIDMNENIATRKFLTQKFCE